MKRPPIIILFTKENDFLLSDGSRMSQEEALPYIWKSLAPELRDIFYKTEIKLLQEENPQIDFSPSLAALKENAPNEEEYLAIAQKVVGRGFAHACPREGWTYPLKQRITTLIFKVR
jgi:hypothetical protein